MVAFGYEHNVVILRQQYCIDRKTHTRQRRFGRSVDALKSKSFWTIQLVEIDLLKIGFQHFTGLVGFMDVMLVRRITRPVSGGSIDFHDDQAVTWETWWDYVIDLSRGMIASTDLDLDITWSNEARLVILIGWSLGNSILAIGFRIDGEGSMPGKIECVG